MKNYKNFLKRAVVVCALLTLASFAVFIVKAVAWAGKLPSDIGEVVIVLGTGLDGSEPGETLRLRLDKALEYYASNPGTLIIVSGGQGPDEIIPEAHAMKAYLVRNGVDPDVIITEDESHDTAQNIRNSKAILDSLFGDDGCYAVIITSDFHVFRAYLYARRAGLNAETLAAPSVPHLLPLLYTREYAAMWKYFLLGKLYS